MASDEGEAAAIASTKEYMKEAKDQTSESIVELKQYSDWQPQVMESSIPVILDCYADWCAPCKKLEPKLK